MLQRSFHALIKTETWNGENRHNAETRETIYSLTKKKQKKERKRKKNDPNLLYERRCENRGETWSNWRSSIIFFFFQQS